MFQVEPYMQSMIDALKERFSGRLLYVGLQGSYLRGEAMEKPPSFFLRIRRQMW